jgi:hypothetical protein
LNAGLGPSAQACYWQAVTPRTLSHLRQVGRALVLVFASLAFVSCAGSNRDAASQATDCRVEFWTVPWDSTSATELDEDSVAKSPLVRRHRIKGCKYAGKARDFMNHAMLLPPSAVPPGGDLRLLVRVRTEQGSWLLGFPQTCSFYRVDRTRLYRHDAELFAFLTKSLPADERQRIEAFGACGPKT